MPLSPSPGPTATPRVGAVDIVLEDLRSAIETGRLSIGEKLPAEKVLCERFGVSRAIVRLAFRALGAMGFTETRNGIGTFVIANRALGAPRFGDFSDRDLLEVRRHVEVPATGYAAIRRDEETVRLLADLCDRMEKEADNAIRGSLNIAFHGAIMRASENQAFVWLTDELHSAWVERESFLKLRAGRREETNREHRAILAAIDDQNQAAAIAAAEAHIANGERMIGEILNPPK